MITDSPSDINQTEGIVLRTYPSGEGDLVIRVLTPEHGKIAIFAKHIRTSRKRHMGGIEIFDCGNFQFNTKKNLRQGKTNLLLLDTFQAKNSPHSLREDLNKLSVANLICEAFDLVIKERQDDPTVSLQYYEAFNLAISAVQESQNKNDLLKTCFLSLRALMCIAGFLDQDEVMVPNKGNLRTVLNRIENCAEKKLFTREDFDRLMASAATAASTATAAAFTFYLSQAFFLA